MEKEAKKVLNEMVRIFMESEIAQFVNFELHIIVPDDQGSQVILASNMVPEDQKALHQWLDTLHTEPETITSPYN